MKLDAETFEMFATGAPCQTVYVCGMAEMFSYVGRTNHPWERLAQHRRAGVDWWGDEVEFIDCEAGGSLFVVNGELWIPKDIARAVERFLIRVLRPWGNRLTAFRREPLSDTVAREYLETYVADLDWWIADCIVNADED